MKVRFALEVRCSDLPTLPLRWWITIVVVIFLAPSYDWSELITLLHH
ncbi:hypothetical protein [Amycolatopsis pittospori]|nr:hypothetical protein [Amycolatopsis pittospori]